MTLHWSWGLSTALILALVIWLNGHQVRAGWLLGAAVQVINMSFGLAYGQETFAFLAIPAGMFLFIWWDSRPKKAQDDKGGDDHGLRQGPVTLAEPVERPPERIE